ncbi:hypothetical protein [Pendulispora albinea]|uniref:Uncharacterized protein n=1 Tax=Pendulispora albinea TaxID=2741071 RepID=A0ABZ2LYK8_9BACT
MSRATELIAELVESGWNTCRSIRDGLTRAGLPLPTAAYLRRTFTRSEWERAARAVEALREHFEDAKFADQASFGILLVPDHEKLDTRGAIDWSMRRGQWTSKGATEDFVDERLPPGKIVVPGGRDWSLVATVTGTAGIHVGSYDTIVGAPRERFLVGDVDTRAQMVRQIWGARVLQSGTVLPDSNERDVWTFTLFPGEGLTGGEAASGTVLHGKVRFRLGRADRGISSVRVCPAILVG